MIEGLKSRIITIDRDVIPVFGNIINDHNRMHRDKKIAEKEGFSDTPVHGIYLLSNFEALVSDNGFDMNKYSIKFKSPAYPGNRIVFGGEVRDGKAYLEAKNGSSLVASCIVDLNSQRPSFSAINSPRRDFNYILNTKDVDYFYRALDKSNNGKMPKSLVTSLIPASLLQMGTNSEGVPVGVFRGIDVKTYSEPEIGPVHTTIYKMGEPKNMRGTFIYNTEGVCTQNGKPILSGDIKVITKQELDF